MNKPHFQTMFSSTSGMVYQFLGEIPDGAKPVAVITEMFNEDSGQDLMSTVVVEMDNRYVLYTDLLEVVTSDNFELVTDLTPDVVVIPEPLTDEQPPEGP
jgi:hypothetical protein